MKTAVWFLSLVFSHSSEDTTSHCVCVCVCFHVHHLIKVRMRIPEQETPLHDAQVFKALGQMLKASGAEISFRRGGMWGPHWDFSKARLCQGWWHRKVRSTMGRRSQSSREGLWTAVSVSPCCPHHQARSLLSFSISLCWGCKSPCMQRTVKGCMSSKPGKGHHSVCRLPCCPLSPQHTAFPLTLAPEGRGPQYLTHHRTV